MGGEGKALSKAGMGLVGLDWLSGLKQLYHIVTPVVTLSHIAKVGESDSKSE